MPTISVPARRGYGALVTPTLKVLTREIAPTAIDPPPIVLLAEPDPLRGALIAAGLEDLGVEVVWVAHGDAALESAEEQSFDVHVADPSLRSRQGERIVQSLVTAHPRVPLVASGSSSAAIHLASAQIPAADVVDLVRAALCSPARASSASMALGESLTRSRSGEQ